MNNEGTPPADVYAGTANVRATRHNPTDAVRIEFSGGFTLAELGPIIAWAVGPDPFDRTQPSENARYPWDANAGIFVP